MLPNVYVWLLKYKNGEARLTSGLLARLQALDESQQHPVTSRSPLSVLHPLSAANDLKGLDSAVHSRSRTTAVAANILADAPRHALEGGDVVAVHHSVQR